MTLNKISDISDNGLFKSVKNDDQKAFEEIYRRYWSKLFIYAHNVLKESEICEDIVQEIFTNLWLRRKEVEISDISPYLYQAVKFQIFKHFRNSKYKNQLIEQFQNFQTQLKTDELAEFNELSAQVDKLVSQLPEKRRTIFHLSRYDEFSNKEISEKLNISLQTVKNEISKALKYIRKSLKNHNFLIF
jgi:RNA polymerase sigma-70 factor (family 1)